MSFFLISQDTKNDVTIVEVSGHELFLRWSRSANVQWTFEISNGVSLLQGIPLQKTLGLLQPQFRLFQLHQCDQGMLQKKSFLNFIDELLLSLFRRPIYQLATFLAFPPQTCMQPRNSPCADVKMIRSKKQQTSPELLIYRLNEMKQ